MNLRGDLSGGVELAHAGEERVVVMCLAGSAPMSPRVLGGLNGNWHFVPGPKECP